MVADIEELEQTDASELHSRNLRKYKTYQDACENSRQHQRRRRDAELLEIQTLGPLDPSASPTDLNPKRSKTTSESTIAWRTKWMMTTFKEYQRHLINWN